MRDRLSVEKCRKLIPDSQVYSDSQIELLRDKLYILAEHLIKGILTLKAIFVTKIQSFTCKAHIVK